jgi:hypothetical protein
MACSLSNDNADGLLATNIALECCLDIYYQNVRALRTKYVDFYDSVCSSDYKIIYLTETWLMDSVFSHNIFPSYYKVFCADRVYKNVTQGGGALIVISQPVSGIKRRFNSELINESVWIEIKIRDGSNLLIGNHYFPPDTKIDLLKSYFNRLESVFDTKNFCTFLIGTLIFQILAWNMVYL